MDVVEASNAECGCQRRETAIIYSVNAFWDPSILTQAETQVLSESEASHPLFCINHFVGANFVCVFGRGWFTSQGSTASLTGSEMSMSSSSSVDLASGDGPVERWGAYGPRPQVSKSTTDPGTDPAATGKPHDALYMYKILSAYTLF